MTIEVGLDTAKARSELKSNGESYVYYSIQKVEEKGVPYLSKLPACLKVVLENLLRFEDGELVTHQDICAFSDWVSQNGHNPKEICFRPARVLMQDFTGVPAVVDLAAMRDAMLKLGGDPQKINPLTPVDLVIDHSVMIDEFGNERAFSKNVDREYERNIERYKFLKWGQNAFKNFRVVPPGTGICHQVNLEYLGRTAWSDVDQNGENIVYPDTLVGTDSHTTMVNGLAILGWGVGGIEAEAAMLGQPISMLIPDVIGFRLTNELREGVTATDLVLIIVKMLREKGVVGKFVEFFGEGLANLPLADRATIANMAPEYGATCGYFPVDEETLRYLRVSGRDESCVALVEQYSRVNGLWRNENYNPVYSDTLELNMETVEPAISGPKRPQDHVLLSEAKSEFYREMNDSFKRPINKKVPVENEEYILQSGSIVIASITSCTNTSNPYVMISAGLLARKARELGLSQKPWVKTSLAPGSQVVTDYLKKSGLQNDLDYLGFNLVGYGCTTCIGNSGPLQKQISESINSGDLVAVSVLSGNRNFEGRISPDVRANYLASPPLVVAYALAGDIKLDLTTEPLGQSPTGQNIFLKDIWPTSKEVNEIIEKTVTRDAFIKKYEHVFDGDERWQAVESSEEQTYEWPVNSTYIQNPPYFKNMDRKPGKIANIDNAAILAILGDMVTTDHISPAGSFKKEHPAGIYLSERQVRPEEFNSYGSRRGNHEVMMRGTFGNIRIRNQMLQQVEGGFTKGPEGDIISIYDAAMAYKKLDRNLVIFAGKEYGAGSSRDWAAKGTALLGVKAVIAESFERIHRSNLVGMGVIPLEIIEPQTLSQFGLTGEETVSVTGLDSKLTPRDLVKVEIRFPDGRELVCELRCRIDTEIEIDYVRNGGVLHYVLRNLAGSL
ncbi:MAG: aconitate hydratase AcnA [Pseudomonadota bacterium]|nr:aconitate hydratase AcnA [Pseudomonadota bacterium]